MKPTFQDQLFTLLQIFWKSGYAYRHSGDTDNELFYSKLLEDFVNLPLEEFLSKYRFR